ncbi:MAG: hypothetical protein WBO06_05940 [Gammaproteobacteria bacterium]
MLDTLIETACQQNQRLQIAALRIMEARARHLIKQQVREDIAGLFCLLFFPFFSQFSRIQRVDCYADCLVKTGRLTVFHKRSFSLSFARMILRFLRNLSFPKIRTA